MLKSVLATALAIFGMTTLVGFTLPTARVASLDSQLEEMRRICVAKCKNCISQSIHEVNAVEEGGTHGRGNHSCSTTGEDCSYHTCAASALGAEVDVIRRLVAKGDVEGLRRMLPADQVVLVSEREVVQVLAECGSVVAQFPMSTSTASTVE